ncbi:MAG: hypothetical protein RSD08_09235 [Oscillospiraceae bacterium]
MFFDSIDMISGKTAEELQAISKHLSQNDIKSTIKPFRSGCLRFRSRWLGASKDNKGYMLSIKKRDLAKADYLLNRLLNGKK